MAVLVDTFLHGAKCPCEDYITAKSEGGLAVISLSDGCSSARFTDIGSRVVANVFGTFAPKGLSVTGCAAKCDVILEAMGVPDEALHATSLVLTHEVGKGTRFSYCGDGVYFVWTIKDELITYNITYGHNAPVYPLYTIRQDLKDQWLDLQSSDGDKGHGARIEKYADGVLVDEISPRIMVTDNHFVKAVGIASDGIASFQRPDRSVVPVQEVVAKIMDFKNLSGQFLKRRMARIIKDYAKEGIVPYDDISVGVLINDLV